MSVITVESLLITLLITLIMLLLLVLGVPAYLERLSVRNRTERDRYATEFRDIERKLRRFERLLIPYSRTRSVAYHSLASEGTALIASLGNELKAAEAVLASLRCPQVFGYLLPVQHFLRAPGHMEAIVSDARLVGQLKSRIEALNDRIMDVAQVFDILAAIPERLGTDRETLRQRLTAIEAVIDREQREGIEALDDFVRDTTAVRRVLDDGGRISATGLPLAELDASALALESAAARLTEAEARAADLERERVALDRRLRRIATDLDSAQMTTKAGPTMDDMPQIRPLLRRAAALLNESAPDHRRRREFNAAGADVSTAAQLITFSRDLLSADRQARLLVERDDGLSLSDPIVGLRSELSELLEWLGREEIDSPSALAGSALAGRAAQLRTRAETLVRRQDDTIAELTREATDTKVRLTRAWDAGQNYLRLDADDPLVRRYANLIAQFDEAQRRPAALEKFRRDVNAFESVYDTWVSRVQATRARIGRIRSSLPNLIDEALNAAAPWNCLVEDVKFIQQRAADFETMQAKFNAVKYRREAESIMDQLETIELEINERQTQLKDKAARLDYLQIEVSEIVGLALGDAGDIQADHPEKSKMDRGLRLIDHHTRSAHAALHYEDASVALLRAAETANKLAL